MNQSNALAVLAAAPAERERKIRGTKAFSVASLAAGMSPAPVAVAEFAGGERIRMSFWQPRGKPWRLAAARRLVAQTIGNERARSGAYAASTKRSRAYEAAVQLAKRGETEDERAAGYAAVERLNNAREVMERLAARIDHCARTNGHPPASDFVDFYIEHDGQRIDPLKIEGKRPVRQLAGPRAAATEAAAAPAPEPRDLVRLLAAVIGNIEAFGPGFMTALEASLIENLRARGQAQLRSRTNG